jgi:hypothetical protein
MPPLSIPKDDLPRMTPQYVTMLLLALFLIGFTIVATVLVMHAFEKAEVAASLPGPQVTVTTPTGETAQIDTKAYIADFETPLGEIKTETNNIFTVGSTQTSLTDKREGPTELRTYVSWSRIEGMPKNQALVTVNLLELTDGAPTPVVTHVETLLNEEEITMINGIAVMFDPVSNMEALITLDSSKYWADKHPGAKH